MDRGNTNKLVLTGLMAAIVTVSTMFIKVPIPATSGYVHLGDGAIFLSVILLGKNRGAAAAGIGSALGDILGGYAAWAPWTLVIKFLMGYAMGVVLDTIEGKSKKGYAGSVAKGFSMVVGGFIMVLGYYIASAVMYSSFIVPLSSIPANIGQFAVGIVIAFAMEQGLYRTPAKKFMYYHEQ